MRIENCSSEKNHEERCKEIGDQCCDPTSCCNEKGTSKREMLGELNVEPVSLQALAKEFLDYLEANRSEKHTREAVRGEMAFGLGSKTLTTAITPRMIQR